MRIFKTKWFTRAACSHAISDGELYLAAEAVDQGRADALGGGVYKRHLNQNRDRAIILAKDRRNGFCVFLYAKQDKANIDAGELAGFRELANLYAGLTDKEIAALVESKELVEIGRDHKK